MYFLTFTAADRPDSTKKVLCGTSVASWWLGDACFDDCSSPLCLTLDEAQQFQDAIIAAGLANSWTVKIEEVTARDKQELSALDAKDICTALHKRYSRAADDDGLTCP
jgi:hypothetical protein